MTDSQSTPKSRRSTTEIDIVAAHAENTAYQKMKKKRKAWGKLGGLNVNSLMDIMTVLLVFLLLTMSSDPLNVQQDDALRLARMSGGCGFERDPSTNKMIAVCREAYSPANDSIPITITKRHILVDGDPILPVQCKIGGNVCTDDDIHRKFDCDTNPETCDPSEHKRLATMALFVDKSYKQDGSDEQFLIEPLNTDLKKRVKEHKELLEELGQADGWRGSATIIADTDIPFRMLAETIYTASMSNLTDMRFALLKTGYR